MQTVNALIRAGTAELVSAGVEAPMFVARALAFHLMGWDTNAGIRNATQAVSPEVEHRFSELIKARIKGVPLQYITQKVVFYDLAIACDERVLIPRQETEILVHEAVNLLKESSSAPRVLDIGTGSGAIALAIKSSVPSAKVLAVDVSAEALTVARKNAQDLCLDVQFQESDIFSSISGKFDLIVSNPPYIINSALPKLQREIQHEPRMALDGGDDGMSVIRPLIEQLSGYLSSVGVAMVEIDPPISAVSRSLAKELLPNRDVSVLKDFNGLARILRIGSAQ